MGYYDICNLYPFFEKLMIFHYSGLDAKEKTFELANLFEESAIDFCVYGTTIPDNNDCTFVVRKSNRKWKEIRSMAENIKSLAHLADGYYYFKDVRFAIAPVARNLINIRKIGPFNYEILGNIREYLVPPNGPNEL
ncbi:hypothetical protein REC12_11890 [Desulfosporosinus sp. PR]|uniref:hypothetical protein n=1 Tax=Candidatus Desulfosporosinus nitrosoreducens TaxID=3401928 RepID=UPI0027F84FCE|nr:hypothetical protein [Desulfosporosinus sp. PR]MDQ7094291.1 hypothetical protein [Desulfosporosinus sp. PR]